ncbi:hypothetical protein I317_05570 [Kwoniella heveanensis CBS 569]|nr:hypothetical protein I317_05570 [Kwoniella heveanensis CBS 569]
MNPSSNEDVKAKADKLVGEGKKAIALKQWEEGVTKYGEALDLMRQLVGEFDPQMAPLLLSYGKALYELAFSQQGVMGKEEPSKEADDAGAAASSDNLTTKGNFVFSDDEAEMEAEAGPSEAASASLTPAPPAQGQGDQEQEQEQGEGEGEENEEPEDDYNAAWEVLDVARTIYQKIVEDKTKEDDNNKEDKLNLAECYVALGDVSCETENFPQAVQDYTSALEIKSALLPPSSRALASVHYQLATVLEFTPNRRSDSLSHVEKALESFKLRLQELKSASASASASDASSKEAAALTVSEEVSKLNEKERENEIKDVEALMGDLEVKIEELKAAPPAGDIVSESINHLLGQSGGIASGSGTSGVDNGPVNDLTSMVKKKKPKAVAAAAAAVNNAAATTAAAVQSLSEGAKQLAENFQSQVQETVTAAAAAAEPVVEQVKEKVGEGAAVVGEAAQSAGEGLKRDVEGEGEEGRAAKKARTE